MSRRAPRSRNVPRIARTITVLIAALAVTVGTVLPVSAATAASVQTGNGSVSVARTTGDPASSGIVKTTLVGFNAGNIISDAVFTNKSTMTVAQIQSFLNGKVTTCRSGYTCLKDLKIATQSKSADKYCNAYAGSSSESAAQIIYKVAQACGINPQVLIVMLQKEQGLVRHTYPSPGRYAIAMGFNCPDTAPCNPGTSGFFTQVYGAARQMQIYMEGRHFTWYAPGKTWNILYNPEPSCGRGPVYIANKATSALYYYTPYQPNAAALRAGYGEAKPCGAYGNRNFYNYFTDWFGSTQTGRPTTAPPKLTSADTSPYVVGVDSAGVAWGYPFSKKVWGARVQLATGLGALQTFFGAGDVNGDGHRDFIAMDSAGVMKILVGDGALALSEPVTLPGNWDGVVDVAPAGDFDGDGVPDLFTTDVSGSLFLRSGDDLGAFSPPRLVGSGWATMSMLVGGIDMNRDGKPDLVARDASGRLFLYPGNGRAGWGAKSQIGSGWTAMTDVFSPGDFTGNGTVDLLAHAADGRLLAYEGKGSSYLASAGVVGSGWHAFSAKGDAGPAVSQPRALPAGFGDVNGALGNDLVALSNTGELRIYGGDGKGRWGSTKLIARGWGKNDEVLAMGDFNSDGPRDLGQVDASGALWLHPGTGVGFRERKQIGHGWGGFRHIVSGVDFDGDRKPDVLAVGEDGRMLLYRGNGSGGWLDGGTQVGHGWGNAEIITHVGDFNGDGRADLVGRFKDGSLVLYPTTGEGGFGPPQQIGRGWGSMTSIVGPGDFDGDQRTDVLAVRNDGAMYLYSGDGKGGWKSSARIGSGWQSITSVG